AEEKTYFRPEHQISDSLYYVHVYDSLNCPYVPEIHQNSSILPGTMLFNTQSTTASTSLACGDSLLFYDDGGANGQTIGSTSTYYYHLFKAEEGSQITIHFDTLALPTNTGVYGLNIYDGSSASASRLAQLGNSGHRNLTYTSTNGSLYLTLRSANGYYGWKGYITTSCKTTSVDLAEAHVSIKAPLGQEVLTATNDTVCYDNTADLTASSSLTYPQYYTWWDNDGTTLLHSDTVTSGVSHFNPEHQISDSLYYVHVYDSLSCPYIPELYKNTVDLAEAHVSIKAPLGQEALTATNDTVCYDNTAHLTATSDVSYPQYYTWWASDGTTLLKQDTVWAEGGQTYLDVNHQTSDSLYYVSVTDGLSCPYVPAVHKHHLMPAYNMNQTSVDTTFLSCGDSIPFYDEGGKNGNTTTSSSYYRIFKAEPGQQVTIHIDTLSLYNSSSYYLRIYDGVSTSGKLLATLYGNKSNLTYTSTSGALYVRHYSRSGYMGWEGSVLSECNPYLAEARVSIKKPLGKEALSAINDTVCYDNSAVLSASSSIGYPQYYSWWASDGTTLLAYDTVRSADDTTHLYVEHQISDSRYYVRVDDSLNCPYLPAVYGYNSYMAQAKVYIKAPLNADVISVANDTVCYDNTASLTASSSIAYPQYYTWWDKDQTTRLWCDTVNSGISHFNPAHQISDSLYYVHVSNDDNCPYVPGVNIVQEQEISNSYYVSLGFGVDSTILLNCGDDVSISFYQSVGFAAASPSSCHYEFVAAPGSKFDFWIYSYDVQLSRTFLKINKGGQQINTATIRPDSMYKYTDCESVIFNIPKSRYGRFLCGIKATCEKSNLAEAHVSIKAPLWEEFITATNDTVCYNNTASLIASSDIAYPQYYTWWKGDRTTLLYRDTVNSGVSHFNPEHQISDSLYYVNVYNDKTCPYDPEVHNQPFSELHPAFLFNTTSVDTTYVDCSDSIPFFDAGGENGDVTAATSTYYYQVFKAAPGSQIVLHIDTLNLYTTSAYGLKIYDGKNSSGTLTNLYGAHHDTTITSTSGYLYLVQRSHSTYMGWKGYFTTTCNGVDILAESQVAVLPYIAPTNYTDVTCQSSEPYSYETFKNIDVSTAGNFTIDSVYKSAVTGCDSIVTLHLTVNPSYNQEENLTLCQNELPYTWRDTTFKAGTITGDYVFNKLTVKGCDSIVTLHLTVNPSYNQDENLTLCQNELPYTWRDTTFKAGT
ncbi:MAG: hypothetical protein MJZ27_11865, partial [Bacteroidales bacterium]|nr:hypothetical protein [Bacteroidales bacterium]